MPLLSLTRCPTAALAASALAVVLIAGCGVGQEERPTPPPAGAGLDYQLGGAYPPPDGVQIVVRDVSDSPAGAGYDVCYVNGFQTQPGESAAWLRDHPDVVLRDAGGEPVADPGWPDELLLDTSTDAQRREIAEVVGAQVDACAKAGFDAVEPDNLDSFSRSDGALTLEDNLALATLLIERAHARGLAIGQKNTVELDTRGPALGFDFVVAEDCAVYDECGDYAAAYGPHVLEIEYDDEPGFAGRLAAACATGSSVVGRDRALSTPDDPGYVLESC
ncbi:Glycoside-hydrolase family GH114 [Sanguibacter gelidistatuariae]|uniref:Glycoside-hydrolase family GH114 n=1 Tax=Sanguibacter gelidistatuariae TaxID=1814289 RepID=A0A1G6XKG6_9MICO|nr:endo alpha-1,4 polygalactosaminidase [Sanguibacter gelidistatuariae]SDD78699.1 Glycoside-hydrolase family GH114 [Sanguibacter gelidistatuariae]